MAADAFSAHYAFHSLTPGHCVRLAATSTMMPSGSWALNASEPGLSKSKGLSLATPSQKIGKPRIETAPRRRIQIVDDHAEMEVVLHPGDMVWARRTAILKDPKIVVAVGQIIPIGDHADNTQAKRIPPEAN